MKVGTDCWRTNPRRVTPLNDPSSLDLPKNFGDFAKLRFGADEERRLGSFNSTFVSFVMNQATLPSFSNPLDSSPLYSSFAPPKVTVILYLSCK